MNLLLDTHVLIWALENNPTLSSSAREAIIDGKNMVFVSSASVWEISIKQQTGKLKVPANLCDELKSHRFTELSMTIEHAWLAGALPDFHNDPFDRMLVAQATVEKLTLVTRDRLIAQYEINLIQA